MANAKNTTAAATPAVTLTPAQALQARLKIIGMAGRRFPEDQKWMQEAIESALDTRIATAVANIDEATINTVNTLLSVVK